MNSRDCTFTAVVVAGLAGHGIVAHAQAPSQPLTLQKINDNIYFVEGDGGNAGIIIGRNGVIVIDTKTTAAAGKGIVDDVAKLTNKPITTVILTHSDGDHVNGLVSFPKNVTIIAHEDDRKEMVEALAAGARGAPPKEYLPNKIVTQASENDTIDGVKLTLIHIAPAHTSGDLAIYLPDEKLVFSGDLIGNGDPTIHLQKHGSSEGWARFVTSLVQLDANTYVRGHAPPATKAEIEEHLKNAQDKRAKIAAMVNDGKSLDEIRQALGERVQTGGNGPRLQSFTDVVYEELTKK